ncbi:MAG TPA: histidine kinase N-terminal 7TM domain-containing protein, partial [Anaerolineales bacterium]|nr:histidine kinase N-terminal 7TM domain-containing protein [Anaerolineales bacterium]
MSPYLFVFSLFLVATITLSFAFRSWQKGASRTIYFSVLLASLSLGTFSYAMELWGTDETVKFVWLSFKYVSFLLSTVFWLLFTLKYTEHHVWLRPPYLFLPVVMPILTILILLSTQQSGWMFRGVHVREGMYLVFDYGPYFWVHTVYMYAIFGLGFILLMRWFQAKQPLRVLQWLGLYFGIILPLITNLMVAFHFPAEMYFDFTPLGMSLGILIIGWILFGLNFAGVNPIAREALIESLKDGVIVIDTQRIITDINPAAIHLVSASRALLGQPLHAALGTPVTLPSLDIADTYPHQEITLPDLNGQPRTLDLRASPLVDRTRLLRGWLLLLRDITEQKRLQTELKKQSLRNAALAEIELAINQPHELAAVLKKIVDTTVDLLPASGGVTIFIWNEETRSFEHADSTLPNDELGFLLSRAQQGFGSAPWIVNEKQPKIVPDTRDEPFGDQDILNNNHIMAYAGFPLIANSKVVGVLYA